MSKVRYSPASGTHRQRVQDAIARGAGAIDGGHVAARWLAGVAAFGDRDGARVLALLRDDSRRVRGVALRVAPHVCDDAAATQALESAWSLRAERSLLRALRRKGRLAGIDAFLDGLAASGRLRDLVDDLPFGSEPAVRRHLAHALERPSERFFRGLALRHPGVLAELVLARWREHDGEADPVTRQLTAAHHPRLAERVPDQALALAELLLTRGIEPAQPVWTELLRRRTEPTLELAIRFASRLQPGVFARRARALPAPVLARIAAHAPSLLGAFGPQVRAMTPDRQRALAEGWLSAAARFPAEGTWLLRYLPAGVARDEAYARWSLAARDRDGVIERAALAALPLELAAREAHRHVHEVTALALDPARRLGEIARYLPWAELERAVADQLGHPEGAVRALALIELIANAGVYEEDASLPPRALALVVARAFEQDPVRLAMLTALGRWPRRLWRAEHLPEVAKIVRAGLDAADLSDATVAAMQQLLARLFRVDAVWAADWLATTIKERGALHVSLGAKLSDADVSAAAAQLLAIARTWSTQERATWLVQLASGLGPRLRLVPGLGELLAALRRSTPHEWIAMQLDQQLARWDPAHHAATLDESVARYRKRRWTSALFALAELHGLTGLERARQRDRRRPTLPRALSDAFVEIARDGRYAAQALALLRRRDPEAFDGAVARLVAKDESFATVPDVHRWLHRHRQDLLGPYLSGRPIRGRFATGKTAWLLPFTDGFFRWQPAQVEQLAVVLDRIVGDRERDLPAVLSALSIWPRLEYAKLDRLMAVASDERPAVRERAIRVLARCDAAQGVPTLLACLGDERARFAIYGLRRALFGMWPERALALLAAAPMHKVTVAKEVVRLTGELRAAGAFARLEQLAAGGLHRDVRIALLRALWDHLDREPTWALFEAAVADPDWVVASRLADIPADRLTAALDDRLAALLARVLARPEPEARIGLLGRARWLALVDRGKTLLAACRERLRSPYDDEVRAAMDAVLGRSQEGDLVALEHAFDALRVDPRALHVAARALCAHQVRARDSWRRAARALERAARLDPRWGVLAIEAAFARGLADEAIAAVLDAAARDALDVDATLAAITGVRGLRDEELSQAVAALAAAPHAAARRVAVAALEHDARPGRGWTAERLAWLARLRADPVPAVAGAAARLWPPREQDPSA